MNFRLGYGTNGFDNHCLDDALAIIADLGYTAVALTLDHERLDPFATGLPARVEAVANRLAQFGLRAVVETGARYLLDPRRKHHPTLVSEDQQVRIDFLLRALAIAADLGAGCVSFWSGISPAYLPRELAWDRLRSGVEAILPEAETLGIALGLEPEPGMLIERLDDALRLRAELGCPPALGITLDVGHCVAVEAESAADCLRRVADLLVNVQLDDMRAGVHEHLEFGQGELDLAACLAALEEIGYTGIAAVELPRHSHAAPVVAQRAMASLRAAFPWVVEAEQRVRQQPAMISELFPTVGRKVGRTALQPVSDPTGLVAGTVDDQARARLVSALVSAAPGRAATELSLLYRHGDDAERRGVLCGLSALPAPAPDVITVGLQIVRDALRTNDSRLVAAALGPFAAAHLEQRAWRHGVLKCLFIGVPLAAVAGLDRRSDSELARMVRNYADERTAAGRAVPDDAITLLTKEVA